MARDKGDIADKESTAQAAAALPASPPDKTLAGNHAPPHPELVRLVRLLARQSALADIAAQRAAHSAEE